jgi:hypothetical protein
MEGLRFEMKEAGTGSKKPRPIEDGAGLLGVW